MEGAREHRPTGSESGFQIEEHTADVAVHAWAPAFEGLLAEFLNGLQTVVFGRTLDAAPAETREMTARETTYEDALIALLNEAIYCIYHQRRVPVGIVVAGGPPGELRITWRLAPIDLSRNAFLVDIKAATYHNLKVERNARYEATVVFDI